MSTCRIRRHLDRRRLVRICAALICVASFVAVPSAPAVALSDVGSLCYARADNPHASKTGKGIDGKTVFICERGSVVIKEYLINLYLCPVKVSGSESGWTTTYGCRVVAISESAINHDAPFTPTSKGVTRQVPPPGGREIHGKGWWVTCTQYYRSDMTAKQRVASEPVQITA